MMEVAKLGSQDFAKKHCWYGFKDRKDLTNVILVHSSEYFSYGQKWPYGTLGIRTCWNTTDVILREMIKEKSFPSHHMTIVKDGVANSCKGLIVMLGGYEYTLSIMLL